MYLRIYLKSIADTLVIVFNEIINGADSVSTNVENIMPTNIANTISINVTSTALQQIMMIKSKILILIVLYSMENHTKIFWFMTFHIKLLLVQNLWVLFSIRQMVLLELMLKPNIWYYLVLKIEYYL